MINWAALATLTVFIAACSKDTNETSPDSRPENSSSGTAKSTSVFDEYGEAHNGSMDYVANHPNFDSLSKHSIYNYIHTYKDTNVTFQGDTNWVQHQQNMNLYIDLANEPAKAAQKLLNEGEIISEQVGLVDSLFTLLANAGDYDNQTYLTVKEFVQSVSTFENHIRQNYTVVYDDIDQEGNFAAVMLAASSVMKSSYSYWRTAVTDSNHPWHTQMTNRNLPNGNLQKSLFGDIWGAIKTAGADVGGFIGGMNNDCNGGGGLWNLGCCIHEAGNASSGV